MIKTFGMRNIHLFKRLIPVASIPKVLLCISVALSLASCSNDDEPKSPMMETEETELVTADTPQLFTALPTYVFNDSYPRCAEALLRRVSNKSSSFEDAVTTVVFTDARARVLDDADMRKIINLYLRGGNIVYVEPTKDGITSWMKHIKNVYQEMAAQGDLVMIYPPLANSFCSRFVGVESDSNGAPLPPFVDESDTDGVICDAIALRGSDIYVVSDLDDVTAGETLMEEFDENTGEILSSVVNTDAAPEMPTDYVYGQHAEALVAWLNLQPEYISNREQLLTQGRNMLTAESGIDKANLMDIIDAQQYKRTFNVAMDGRSEPVTLTYYIWNASDKTNMTDYYLVKETVTLENSKLRCGPTDEKMWHKNNTYGPFMYQFSTEHSFSNRSVNIEQVSPVNSTSGSSTYTHGFDWSLNSALTFSKDPSLGIGGGVSFSKSWSYDIPDLKMTHSQNGNAPKWGYTAGTRPTSHFGVYVTHTTAKPILRTDCIVSHSWIWKMPNASGTYSFTTNANVRLQTLGYNVGFFKTHPYYNTKSVNCKQTFQLAPPPRYVQEWIMSYTPYSNDVQTTLERQFPKYWKLAFDLPVVTLNDRTMIDNRINTLINLLNNNRSTLHDKKIDKLNITWKLLNSSEAYRTYEYKY